MDTSERLIRFRVVAKYHRNDSKGVSVVIHPDQSIAQIIPNVRSVSIARKSNGLWNNPSGLGDSAVFERSGTVEEIKNRSTDIQQEISNSPDYHQPSKGDKKKVIRCTRPNRRYSEKKFKQTKWDANSTA